MRRVLVAVVSVAGLTFSAYVVNTGTIPEQVAFLTDAGFAPPNRDCSCPARLDEAFAADAGLKLYQRVLFPCTRTVLLDGGIDIQMPPMPQGARQAIDVVDWNDCTLAASTAPVRALAGTSRPFLSVSAANKPWCRQNGAGLPCVGLDGGTRGNRNVSLCTQRANPATCERVGSGVVYLGDSAEDIQ